MFDLVALDIPPGVYNHGVESDSENRWREAQFCRWTNGSIEPVGGSQKIAHSLWQFNQLGDPIRGVHTWATNSGIDYAAFGTPGNLWIMDDEYQFAEITPDGLVDGNASATLNLAYGGLDYGESAYGTPRVKDETDTEFIQATSWQMDNFGEDLIAYSSADGRVFRWTYSPGGISADVFGPDEILNGSFDSTSNWTAGTGWTIAGGVASYDGVGGGTLSQSLTGLDTGAVYYLEATIESDDADILVDVLGGKIGVGRGRVMFQPAAATQLVEFSYAGSSEFTIDNVKVKSVDRAAPLSGAPANNRGVVVTDERFVMLLGSDGVVDQVSWSDRENAEEWTPDVTNEAGDIRLATAGSIECAVKVRGRTLILTSVDAHTATYQGPPTVYGFERVGNACGVISPAAAVAVGSMAFWMGYDNFFIFDGSTVTSLPCEVHDRVFSDINFIERGKVSAVSNQLHNEVWWFYPTAGTENDRYVYFNYKDQYWGYGAIDRSSGDDSGVFFDPIWSDSTGNIYSHEVGYIHQEGDEPVSAATGPLRVNEGNKVVRCNELVFEESKPGATSLTIEASYYPNDSYFNAGSIDPIGSREDVRFTGRRFRFTFLFRPDEFFRFGKIRMRIREGGYR